MKKNQPPTAPATGNFWEKLAARTPARPILVLAPMADVTDAAFRRVIAKYGKPDAIWTEFVSADGLCLADEAGRAKLMKDLIYTEAERPIVAQFFSAKPALIKQAAALARKLGFDGIDINMGCPDRSIEKQGAGAALIKTPALAREIIRAAKEGAAGTGAPGEDGWPDLPVSVKTRIGFNKNEIETWLPELLAEEPAVITVHARTRKEMSKVPARWEEVKRAVEIRDAFRIGHAKSKTLIFGNGDVMSVADALERAAASGCDGVMLGRAIFGNPWLFRDSDPQKTSGPEISIKEKLTVLAEHTKLFEELLGGVKNFAIMKKHFKAYVHGWDGAKELRMQLMETENAGEVAALIFSYLSKNPAN